MADLKSSLATIATAAVLATGSAQAEKASDFSDLINAGGAKVEAIQTNTRNANSRLVNDTQPMLLAQAAVETDGNTYTAEILQVDGPDKGKKIKVFFKRNVRGGIIPLLPVDGRLLDGTLASNDASETRNKQRALLGSNEVKVTTLLMVKAEKLDFVEKISKNIGYFATLAEQGKLTKDQLSTAFYSTYVVLIGLGSDNDTKSIDGLNSILNGLLAYGKISLKLSQPEIQSIKQKAEQKAKDDLQRYSSATA